MGCYVRAEILRLRALRSEMTGFTLVLDDRDRGPPTHPEGIAGRVITSMSTGSSSSGLLFGELTALLTGNV